MATRLKSTLRTVVHLFPGQGDFAVSPLVRAIHTHPPVREAVAEVFEHADPVGAEFGIAPLGPWLLGASPPSGRDLATASVGTAQLALFCSSVAVSRALSAVGIAPDRVVGVSFGEIAALTSAGAFDIADGARIACVLAGFLSRCGGGMLLLGVNEAEASALMRAVDAPGLALACVNDPGETVVSGPSAAVEAVERLARQQGLEAARLRLPFLSHHPSLKREADAFATSIRAIPVGTPRVRVHSAVLGRAYLRGDDIRRGLANCLTHPVRLPEVLRGASTPPALLLEAGTGRSLTRNARRTLPASGATAQAPLADPGFPWRDPRRLHASRPGTSALPLPESSR
ncbi:acyltransferase domain-containing protein [Streptomyces olivoreticuli]